MVSTVPTAGTLAVNADPKLTFNVAFPRSTSPPLSKTSWSVPATTPFTSIFRVPPAANEISKVSIVPMSLGVATMSPSASGETVAEFATTPCTSPLPARVSPLLSCMSPTIVPPVNVTSSTTALLLSLRVSTPPLSTVMDPSKLTPVALPSPILSESPLSTVMVDALSEAPITKTSPLPVISSPEASIRLVMTPGLPPVALPSSYVSAPAPPSTVSGPR